MTKFYYTGIGSREISESERNLIHRVSGYLLNLGFTLRSGHAPGSDEAFEVGTFGSALPDSLWEDYFNANYPEIYVPWNNFKGADCQSRLISSEDAPLEIIKEAEGIVSIIHPYWHNLKQGAKKLHTRNVFQVLGKDLKTPSQFVLYCSNETSSGNVSGGTATAVNLARKWEIPCFNIRNHTAKELNDFISPLIPKELLNLQQS